MATKIKELREQTNEELATSRRDLKHELLNLRAQQESGQLDNPARIRLVRREIAKIETLFSERRTVPAKEAATAAAQ